MNGPSSARHDACWWLIAAALAGLWAGPALGQPAELWGHSAIYDPGAQRMLVFGGIPTTNATWQLSLDEAPRWDPVTPLGGLPQARYYHSAIYDPVRRRMLVFGGLLAGNANVADVWSLDLASPATWDSLQPAGAAPPPRAYHSAIYDPVRDRMVVFGGFQTLAGAYYNDVWSLWLSPAPRWELVTPTGAPPTARLGHSAIYDPVRDRMVVFGGSNTNEVWALSFADTTWRPVATSGATPLNHTAHTAVYDPIRDAMLVFGGTSGNQTFNDVWELTLSGTPAWTQRSGAAYVPTPRQNHSAVFDTTFHRMAIFGGFPDVTEPTWALSFRPTMRWSPARALVDISPADLALVPVTLGDTVSVPFTVTNGGLNPLQVSEIRLPSGMRLSTAAPLHLPWIESVAETLTLAAGAAGFVQDSMLIVSNDPSTPRRAVGLSYEVLALDFATRVLDEPAEVPLGASFVAVVTPSPGVHVERGTLCYRIADGASPYDSVSLTPLATDFIATIPAAAVTEHGVEYYVRVENSGFSSVRPAGAPATPYFQAVAAPATLSAIPRPTSGAEFLASRDIEVDVLLPDGAVFGSGTLHYRPGGGSGDSSIPLSAGGVLGHPVATIPAADVGPRGVEYWVEVNTLSRALRYPATQAAVLRTRVQNLTEPAEHPAGRYRLLSVPLDFGDDFSGNLNDLLTDQLGTYDPVRWRAYRFDAASQGNVELSTPPADEFKPEPGRAFWIITRDAHRIDTKPIAGTSTPTGSVFGIALRSGWNLIGNPFDFPVAWADVMRNTAAVGDPVAFDPTLRRIGDYADAAPTVLAPFEGYFVHATAAETLWVPPLAAPPTMPAASAREPHAAAVPANAAGESWRFRLEARSEGAVDGSNSLGVQPDANAGFDPLDSRKPPIPPGAWVQAAFAHADWGGESGLYRRDLRGVGTAGETWEVEVRSGNAGEPVVVEVSRMAAASGLELRVVDREQGMVVDGTKVPTQPGQGSALRYTIVSLGPRPYRLAIIAGTPEYVAQAVQPAPAIPARLTLEPGAPNPFRFATRIRFGLPRAAAVDLEVFNVLGQRVATPLRRAPLGPGYHSEVWDGRLADGAPAPSGVYLVRVTTGREALTGRLILVR